MAKVVSKANQSQGMLMFKLTLQQNFAIGTLKVREIVPTCQPQKSRIPITM